MAIIGLARIDSRLVHGQVTTKWLKQVTANRVVIIDSALAKDPFMSKVYAMAAPPGISVEVMPPEIAAESWQKDQMGEGKLMLIFKNVPTAAEAWQRGLEFELLQVGGLGGAPGRKAVYQNITLNADDAESLKTMAKGGVAVTFQTIPEDRAATLESVLERVKL